MRTILINHPNRTVDHGEREVKLKGLDKKETFRFWRFGGEKAKWWTDAVCDKFLKRIGDDVHQSLEAGVLWVQHVEVSTTSLLIPVEDGTVFREDFICF
jgi:hypothetical protein